MIGILVSYYKDWQIPHPEWSVYRSVDWGYTRIQIQNKNSLHFEFIKNVDGRVHDDIWITNWALE